MLVYVIEGESYVLAISVAKRANTYEKAKVIFFSMTKTYTLYGLATVTGLLPFVGMAFKEEQTLNLRLKEDIKRDENVLIQTMPYRVANFLAGISTLSFVFAAEEDDYTVAKM